MSSKPNRRLYVTISKMIEANIRSNGWTTLPSYREMCAQLEVSQSTLEAALEQLTRTGVLEPAIPRKRRVVTQGRGAGNNGDRRICFLSAVELSCLNDFSQDVVHSVFESLRSRGWKTEFVRSSAIHSRSPEQQLPSILSGQPNTTWIVYDAGKAAIDWAEKHNSNWILFGGEGQDAGFPCVGKSIGYYMELLLRRYVRMGHHRIVVPLSMRGSQSNEGIIARLEELFHQYGLNFSPSYNTPEVPIDDSEAWKLKMSELFKYTPPTVMLFFCMKRLILTQTECLARGVSIPSDLRLVDASDSKLTKWLSPQPDRITSSVEDVAKVLKKWVRSSPSRRPSGLHKVPVSLELVRQ